jgi:hypothetical protein
VLIRKAASVHKRGAVASEAGSPGTASWSGRWPFPRTADSWPRGAWTTRPWCGT